MEEAPRQQRRARKRNAAVAAAIEAEEWRSDADEENSEEETGENFRSTFIVQGRCLHAFYCPSITNEACQFLRCLGKTCIPDKV